MKVLRTRTEQEAEERTRLAPFAMASADSAGRVVPEAPHPYRTHFQRDRDRIVHARAFRRLQYKTQVFVCHEGDHDRNRLTHTLEAAQIARTVARVLRLNEDLAEAVVLAHDLGHTPFGHAGERVLAELLRAEGGFDHNRQSLRVVDLLEQRYPRFRGLNLTDETRGGILKHGAHFEHPVPLPRLTPQPLLEAQLADAADEIAYTSHDVDDGLRSEILHPRALAEVPLWRDVSGEVVPRLPAAAEESVVRSQHLIALLDRLITDLEESTAAALEAAGAVSVEEVRQAPKRLVGLSSELRGPFLELKRFLADRFYHHPRVLARTREAEGVLRDLFLLYRKDPSALPEPVRARFSEDGEARAIADYVAGMTDRFAMAEYRRLRGRR